MPDPTPTSPLEPVWFVEATYAPDAAATRIPFRAEHLAGIRKRLEAGVYVEAGAFADVSSSVVLVRAESEAAALALVSDFRKVDQQRDRKRDHEQHWQWQNAEHQRDEQSERKNRVEREQLRATHAVCA